MVARIAVTGMGLVSPLGLDVRSYWHGLLEGRSGVSFITAFPTERLRSDVAAQVTGAGFFKVDVAPYPTVMRIATSCMELAPFAKAHPLKQPGAPASLSH